MEVPLDGRGVVHGHVHGGGQQAGAGAAHEAEGHGVVGQAVGEFSDGVSGAGDYQVEVCPAWKVDVLEGASLDGAVLEVDGALGERRKGEGGHETGGSLGHGHADLGAFLLQQAQEFTALVGGDSAGDSQEDFLSVQVHKSVVSFQLSVTSVAGPKKILPEVPQLKTHNS